MSLIESYTPACRPARPAQLGLATHPIRHRSQTGGGGKGRVAWGDGGVGGDGGGGDGDGIGGGGGGDSGDMTEATEVTVALYADASATPMVAAIWVEAAVSSARAMAYTFDRRALVKAAVALTASDTLTDVVSRSTWYSSRCCCSSRTKSSFT